MDPTESLACTDVENTEKDDLNCPICKRDYIIVAIYHQCNPLLTCGRPHKRFVEKYLPVSEYINTLLPEDKCYTICNSCDEEQKKMTSARKNICPDCGFSGW